MGNKIIAIIPVCSGSKGISRKNSRLLAEKLKTHFEREWDVCIHCRTIFIMEEGININKNTDRGDDK